MEFTNIFCLAIAVIVFTSKRTSAQETNVIEIITGDEPTGTALEEQQASGRTLFGPPFKFFDGLAYKENLLHNKISFLFSLIPRPAHYYRPPYFGINGPYPMSMGPGAIPPAAAIPPNVGPYGPYPAGFVPGGVPYPGYNGPFLPPGAGGFVPPGTLPVVAENNTSSQTSLTGGKPQQNVPTGSGGKPSASAVAAPTTPPQTQTDETESASATEEEAKKHKTIKMMPKSFKMN